MTNEKYICPLCGNEMHWTGYISQDTNNKKYRSILYKYRCGIPSCGYEKKYKRLDSAGIIVKNMIDAEGMEYRRNLMGGR